MKNLQKTTNNKLLGATRLMLGLIFTSTGIMKFTFPMLSEAWSGQLIQAKIPLYEVNVVVVPIMEILIGLVLLWGFYSRIVALIVIPIMFVAIYVHLVVDDPNLFPLQPSQPVIPIIVLVMAIYVILRGGGAWSRDLKAMD